MVELNFNHLSFSEFGFPSIEYILSDKPDLLDNLFCNDNQPRCRNPLCLHEEEMAGKTYKPLTDLGRQEITLIEKEVRHDTCG